MSTEAAHQVIDLAAGELLSGYDSLLDRVAVTLGSTLDIDEVLPLLAEMGRDATSAERCSVFVLHGRELHPAAAISRHRDDALWQTFQVMEPIRLDLRRWQALCASRPLVFPDARASDGLVPPEWLERFSVGALVLVPLTASGKPCGLMAVDWCEPRAIPDQEVALLETMGRYAGIAVGNARLHDAVRRRARLQEALGRGAAALSPMLDTDELVGRIADACTDLVDPRMCAVGLLDSGRTQITSVAVRGAAAIDVPIPLAHLPRTLVQHLRDVWEGNKPAVRITGDGFLDDVAGGRDAGAAWYTVVPLLVEGHTRGAVVLGFEDGRELDPTECSAVDALGHLAGAALERRVLLDRLARRYRQLDTLYQASAALTDGAGARELVAQLNTLLAELDIEVTGIALRERRLQQHLGGDTPSAQERAAWKGGSWRPGDRWVCLGRGRFAVPMRLGKRLVGTLRVRAGGVDTAELDGDDRAFVEAVARGIAEVADRACLRTAVQDAAREQALTSERDRMASDLHDTAGHVLVAIGLLANEHAEHLDDGSPTRDLVLRLAALAKEGKWEIDQAVRALAFVPAAGQGLTASLRAHARSFTADSGVAVDVAVQGRPVRLDTAIERALYRVAHEALANAWRHARCSRAHLELHFRAEDVVLRVTDDGVGFGDAPPEEHMGIAGMRRALREVHGTLRIHGAEPRGAVVEATVTKGAR